MTNSIDANPEKMVESLLFVASGPVPVSRLATALGVTVRQIEQILYALQDRYLDRGLNLQWNSDGVQLTSAPEAAGAIEAFLGLEATTRLSPAALEVLAIVAYLQPVTRPHVDSIRGVSSDGALRRLLTLGLIEEVGRQETAGRPILYGTTADFLHYFGLSSLTELPPLPDEAVDALATDTPEPDARETNG